MGALERPPEARRPPRGRRRHAHVTVNVDPAQYHKDMKQGLDVYRSGGVGGLNLLVRRKGKENNFKSVLETIRDLMNTNEVGKAVPHWLHDLFLGYGDPSAAHYKVLLANQRKQRELNTLRLNGGGAGGGDEDEDEDEDAVTMDFRDTFLDAEHVKSAFPDADVSFDAPQPPSPPYKLTFSRRRSRRKKAPARPKSSSSSSSASSSSSSSGSSSSSSSSSGSGGGKERACGVVRAWNPGPYPHISRQHRWFTAAQSTPCAAACPPV